MRCPDFARRWLISHFDEGGGIGSLPTTGKRPISQNRGILGGIMTATIGACCETLDLDPLTR
jgi:hypothetical protein